MNGADASAAHGFGRLLLAEWTKFRSVRSTLWSLVAFFFITVGVTALLTESIVFNWTRAQAGGEPVRILADPVSFILGAGLTLGQLTVAALGVLMISAEYSSGLIRPSILASPRRVLLLDAKACVLAAVLIPLTETVAFASFFVGSVLLYARAPVGLSDPGVLRAVIGAGLYLTVMGLFSLALGALIRHTAGAIIAAIGVFLVLPALDGIVPGRIGADIVACLPEQAGSLIYHSHRLPGQLLAPWEGFGVLCLWTLVMLAAAAVALELRDA